MLRISTKQKVKLESTLSMLLNRMLVLANYGNQPIQSTQTLKLTFLIRCKIWTTKFSKNAMNLVHSSETTIFSKPTKKSVTTQSFVC
jgi:hypothetical protein